MIDALLFILLAAQLASASWEAEKIARGNGVHEHTHGAIILITATAATAIFTGAFLFAVGDLTIFLGTTLAIFLLLQILTALFFKLSKGKK